MSMDFCSIRKTAAESDYAQPVGLHLIAVGTANPFQSMKDGDAVRNTTMSYFSCTNSACKAGEVAKRRAAIQQEIEQRQRLARKLQDEKMARAIAQKEERLLKQRKAQQREILRAKMVLDRRTQVLAEKEKEKKEAMLAKMHILASRLTIQHKSRPVYAFGSSTPRELEYLTQLTREQKIYDHRLMPSDRSPTPASGSFSHLSLAPSYDLHNYTPEASMTGSFYIARPELKSCQKPSSRMTQSMMITSKPNKSTKINQTFVNHHSTIQPPITVTKTPPSAVTEMPMRTKRPIQHHVLAAYGQRPRTRQSKSSETRISALKAKSMPRTVHKLVELQTNNEIKEETIMEKLTGDQIDETVVILEKGDVKIQDDKVLIEVRNAVDIKEATNLIPHVNEIKKLDGEDIMVEVSDGKKLQAMHLNLEETNTAATITMIDMVIDQKTKMHEKQRKEKDILKEAGIELQGIMQISEINHSDFVSVCPASAQNVENTAKERVKSPTQSNSTLKADRIEIVAEDLKLVGEKNSLEEKRRIQDELLEKEQREREIRKAKLASIMSRTRGGAPSMTVVPLTLHVENSDIVEQETLKHRTSVPLSSEYSPVKSALSHTTASVLQKLATTNPKLLSVLQRNGTSQSLADELSAVDSSMSVTLRDQPVESVASHEGSSTVRQLSFEPDVNHRPVAMK
ncbi:hypothetical protein DINM_003429 [Dirofilaria immitis]|nr:hypothetical protein [Dirofilaria immitis]